MVTHMDQRRRSSQDYPRSMQAGEVRPNEDAGSSTKESRMSDNAAFRATASGALAMRLEEYVGLSDEARALLDRLFARSARKIEARRDLIRQGETPEVLYLIKSGWACRYKVHRDGRRQIVDFLIPGDLCELNMYILSAIDHSIG